MLKLAELQEVCGNLQYYQKIKNGSREIFLYYFSVGSLLIKAYRVRDSDDFWTIYFGYKFRDFRKKLFYEFFSSRNFIYDKNYLRNVISQLNPQNYEYRPFSVNELIENSKKTVHPYPQAYKNESNLNFKINMEFALMPQECLSLFEKTNWKLVVRNSHLQKYFDVTNPTLVKNILFYQGQA